MVQLSAEESAIRAARARLRDLALNLWWTWHPEVVAVFQDLDPALWRETNHNPTALLARLPDGALSDALSGRLLEGRLNFQHRRLEEYELSSRTWCAARASMLQTQPIAYFSAEFGLHESLPLYSGGLGVLSGDHLKSASDLGVPLVGVGLFYARGYFRQRLDSGGWQHEEYGATDIRTLPMAHAAAPEGSVLTIDVECGSGPVRAAIWLAHVGRVRLVLLDSDVDGNPRELRGLTSTLYGGDEQTRIRQEILLGIGGLRALRTLGIDPSVFHLNEGHSAFTILERVREHVEDDRLNVEEALRRTTLRTVFTTHTPVPAGHDRFSSDLVERELGWLRQRLGLELRPFMTLGQADPSDPNQPFVMTVLALRASRRRNGVSSLHGELSRQMWHGLYPGRREEEVPIGHVTNGVHLLSWLAPEMKDIYDRCLGPGWAAGQADPETWAPLDRVDDGELWEAHVLLRRRLVEFVRRRVGDASVLDPRALTIGFARRFTAYKRPTLLLSDIERLAALCGDRDRPVQFVLAGKAHPRDEGGKALVRTVIDASRDPRLMGRLVFLEDYDINVGRHLVQGVDVWLNTPLRPLEASGTSGQKVVVNGGVNLSTLDGWWAEAFDGSNGFAIGNGRTNSDADVQWSRDAAALYDTLEGSVIPSFFEVDRSGIPRGWIERMRHSVQTLAWRYNADRMVMDYVTRCYLPAAGGLTSEM